MQSISDRREETNSEIDEWVSEDPAVSVKNTILDPDSDFKGIIVKNAAPKMEYETEEDVNKQNWFQRAALSVKVRLGQFFGYGN